VEAYSAKLDVGPDCLLRMSVVRQGQMLPKTSKKDIHR
jgi:hypothetical protein